VALTEKQLGQLRPANTTAASLYSPGVNVTTIISTIVICNTSGAAATCRLFHDDDGTTYDQTTALMYDTPVPTEEPLVWDRVLAMDDFDGNIGVRSSVNNALTFTAYGAETT